MFFHIFYAKISQKKKDFTFQHTAVSQIYSIRMKISHLSVYVCMRVCAFVCSAFWPLNTPWTLTFPQRPRRAPLLHLSRRISDGGQEALRPPLLQIDRHKVCRERQTRRTNQVTIQDTLVSLQFTVYPVIRVGHETDMHR